MNYQLLEDIESELKWQQSLSNEDMELGAFSTLTTIESSRT
ncbi:hypothetical protein MiAbW_03284 [Microcystis aeruginosa NIES-4325]|uniref:Uncharacterized protein n=5 Tax=Microcystis aeruginosa TaxID=1126 RepID=A0A5J4FBK7_MICAE|nr:hypothetical protein [Microcystis aeruginosa]GEA28706.1 hypothetical protein MiAbW_03284 [Microcystis aeruginosa NIES-4325]